MKPNLRLVDSRLEYPDVIPFPSHRFASPPPLPPPDELSSIQQAELALDIAQQQLDDLRELADVYRFPTGDEGPTAA